MTRHEPPAPYAYRLALKLAWGERAEAEHLLEQMNRLQRCFGFPEYTMPSPAGPTDGLITAPAVPYERMSIDLDEDGGRLAA